jgi:ribonuclease P/MRP protein subunit POP1
MHHLQLHWNEPPLRQVLSLVCDPLAVTPCSARFVDGARACTIDLYEPGAHPRGLVGPVTLLWQGAGPEDAHLRTLLVSVHPAIAADVVRIFRRTLEVVASELPAQHPIYGLSEPKLCSFSVGGRRAGELLGRALLPSRGSLSGAKKVAWPRVLTMAPDAFPADMVIGIVADDPRLR